MWKALKMIDVSGRISITLPRNLSVTANFLRPQSEAKKETLPGGAGNSKFSNKNFIFFFYTIN